MIETLFGTLLGGVFRMAPEVLKWLDRKDERKHELAMLDKQIDADRLKLEAGQKLADTQAEERITLADLQAMIEATKAQAVQTGVRWVDALSSLMRPTITFWWVIVLYTGALVAQFLVLVQQGDSGVQAILHLWGPDERAIVASIVAFWFVDRSLRKR
jgi:squalene cyclase